MLRDRIKRTIEGYLPNVCGEALTGMICDAIREDLETAYTKCLDNTPAEELTMVGVEFMEYQDKGVQLMLCELQNSISNGDNNS